jgi:hypothetical protein
MSNSNNPPEVLISLTKEQAEFLKLNCETNIEFALGMLQNVSEDAARKLIANLEQFKVILEATNNAMKE